MKRLSIRKILVALSDVPDRAGPLPAAIDLVQRLPNAELVLFHAILPRLGWEQRERQLRADATARLEALSRPVPAHVPVTVVSRIGPAARAICQVAREYRADLVALGSHELAGVDHVLRTTAERVARASEVPVLTVPHAATSPGRGHVGARSARILVPVDFSPASRGALHYATRFAAAVGGSVKVLHAWQAPSLGSAGPGELLVRSRAGASGLRQMERDDAEERLRQASWFAGSNVEREACEGDPAEVILAAAKECDLLLLGRHARPSASGALRRRVASRLVRYATCPVLTVSGSEPVVRTRPARVAAAIGPRELSFEGGY